MRIVRLPLMAEASFSCPWCSEHGTVWLWCASSCLRLRARLEQAGKGRPHVDEDDRPQHRYKERLRKPLRGHQDVESEDVDDHRGQYGYCQRHVTVGQQEYRCYHLKREDDP